MTAFRLLKKGLLVQVCEGDGKTDDPYRLVYYVYTEDGELIGSIDHWRQEKLGIRFEEYGENSVN